jgi:Cupin domain
VPAAGEEIHGPGGYRLRLLRVDDVLEMEASYPGTGGMPPEHLHPSQDERFEVLEGTIRAIVAGEERAYEVGEIFDVPAGTPHQMGPDGGPARMRWEVTPALRTAEFFERMYSGEVTDFPAFLEEFSAEFRLTSMS